MYCYTTWLFLTFTAPVVIWEVAFLSIPIKAKISNAIIASILMTRRPDEVRMLMIDPKMVELSCYKTLPHLMHPVVTDMRKAEAILAWAVEKMEERYELLARAGVRHLAVYNQLGEEELIERIQPETEEERVWLEEGRKLNTDEAIALARDVAFVTD